MSEGRSVERRLVTVLFADLVGFTALSEQLDAEEVATIQDRYFGEVRSVVGRYGGRLEKFIGDAAMAVFGLPRTRDDDAERAVRAGLALVNAIEGLTAGLGLAEGSLRLRVGVNSGEVAYGADADNEWRVSGDPVNVAARLQTAAEPGGVLVGDATALAVAETIALDRPQSLELKGKVEPVRAWRAATVLPQRSRERAMGALRAPLLGRAAEMARLTAELERARGGASPTLIIVAPPGVGKTRLVEEFALAAGAVGGKEGAGSARVWRARFTPEASSPAAAVGQLVASALADHGIAADEAQPALSRLLHAAGVAADRATTLAEALLEPAAALDIDGGGFAAANLAEQREARLRDWIEGLDGLAAGRSAIWLLEDLHWAAGDVLALLERTVEQPAARGRLVLATARPVVLESLSARHAAGGQPLETLELTRLAAPAARSLIDELVGDALPPELSEAIVERSDGNPLFIEELLRTWVSLGALVQTDGAWRLMALPEEVTLPSTVQGIYAAQLDDLPDAARELTRRGAVAGRHVPRGSLPALEVTAEGEAVEVVLRRALMSESALDPIVGRALGYRHVLLRDAGYGSLARAERARLHARLAAWYETVAADRADDVAEQIAGHYSAAIDNSSRLTSTIDERLDVSTARDLAAGWYERAGRRALASAAHESGRRLLSEALRHATDDRPLVRARLQLALGETTAYTADMDEGAALVTAALEAYRQAYAQADGERDNLRAGYAAAAAALGRIWQQQLRFAEAGRLANEAITAIGPPEDEAVARLLAIRGWVASTLTEDRAALDDLDRALAIARQAADRRLELEMLEARATVLGELGMVELDDWLAVEQIALELGDAQRAVRVMRVRAAFLVDDEHARVWPLADQAEEISRRLGRQEDLCWIDYLRAEAGFVSGDWERALAAGRRGIELGERNNYHRAVVRTWHVLLPIAEARAERELIEQAFAWYSALAGFFPDSPYSRIVEAAAHLVFMRAGLQQHEVPAVEPRLASLDSAPGGPSWVAAIESVVESWLDGGELDGAQAAVERLERAVAAEPATSHLGRGSVELLRARLEAARGAPPASVEQAARGALEHFRESRADWWIVRTLSVLAVVAGADQAELDEVAEISRRLGLNDR